MGDAKGEVVLAAVGGQDGEGLLDGKGRQAIEWNLASSQSSFERTAILPLQAGSEDDARTNQFAVRKPRSGEVLNCVGKIVLAALLRSSMPDLVTKLHFQTEAVEQLLETGGVAFASESSNARYTDSCVSYSGLLMAASAPSACLKGMGP